MAICVIKVAHFDLSHPTHSLFPLTSLPILPHSFDSELASDSTPPTLTIQHTKEDSLIPLFAHTVTHKKLPITPFLTVLCITMRDTLLSMNSTLGVTS